MAAVAERVRHPRNDTEHQQAAWAEIGKLLTVVFVLVVGLLMWFR